MIDTTTPSRREHYPVYAFRRSGQTGWSLIACGADDAAPEASARALFPDLIDWRASGLGHNGLGKTTPPPWLLQRESRDTYSGSRDPSWAWDDVAQCWRAPNECIAPPRHVERVDRLDVAFSQPSHGWIDLKLSTPTQSVQWPLSEVYDPFRSELTSWMEAVVEQAQPRLFVCVEHVYARLDVIPAEGDMVIIVAHSVAVSSEETPLAAKMPRSAFVRDFYSAFVAFWEGEDLRKNWGNWLVGIEDWAPGEDAKGYWVTEPWPIRSDQVERYLAERPA